MLKGGKYYKTKQIVSLMYFDIVALYYFKRWNARVQRAIAMVIRAMRRKSGHCMYTRFITS